MCLVIRSAFEKAASGVAFGRLGVLYSGWGKPWAMGRGMDRDRGRDRDRERGRDGGRDRDRDNAQRLYSCGIPANTQNFNTLLGQIDGWVNMQDPALSTEKCRIFSPTNRF